MGYRKLEVYQISYKLTMKIYEASKKYPPTEQYGLTSQIRRASMSIALNSEDEFNYFSESYEILSKKLYRLKENWKPKSDI
jgi:hypothetical protein